jgi:hypothetical protein
MLSMISTLGESMVCCCFHEKKKNVYKTKNMDDDSLWNPYEDATFESFTNEYGDVVQERRAPTPPASLRRSGDVGPIQTDNFSTLQRHIGERRWAFKNEVEAEDMFETDRLSRPVEQFVNDHRIRGAVQLNSNRNNTQPEKQREDFEPRAKELYNGKNPIRLPTLKHMVTTRRGEQEASVVGAERSGDPRYALSSDREAARSVGEYQKKDDEERARASHITKQAGSDTKLKLAIWSGLRSLAPNNRATAWNKASSTKGDAVLSQYDSTAAGNPDRVTSNAFAVPHVRGDIVLSSHDSQTASKARATHNDVRSSALSGDVVLSQYDSENAPNNDRLSTLLSYATRFVSSFAIGASDSQPHRKDFLHAATIPAAALRSEIAPANSIGPVRGSTGRDDHRGEYARATESVRARDAKQDAKPVERLVANMFETRKGQEAKYARRLRDGPVGGSIRAKRSEHDALPAVHEVAREVKGDATPLEGRRTRNNEYRRGEEAAHSRVWNSRSTVHVVPVARTSVDVVQEAIPSRPPRRWKGVDKSTRSPTIAGPPKPFTHITEQASTTSRRTIAATPGRPTHPTLRVSPSLYVSENPLRT